MFFKQMEGGRGTSGPKIMRRLYYLGLCKYTLWHLDDDEIA